MNEISTNEAVQREIIARYLAAYNRFDIEGMLALMSDDVTFENVSGGQVTAAASGIGAFRALAERAKALFREREQRLLDITFQDGVAKAKIAYRGVLAVDLPGGPAAGEVLELVGKSEFEFGNGPEVGKIRRLVDRS